jgi:hypothetical protein
LKDRYYKKGNLRLTIDKCIKGPIVSWIDYQRNHVELIDILEQNITEIDEEQNYWENRPSLGYIFSETIKEITRKAWIQIKFNYILGHPELLPKFLPLITYTIQPISLSVEYSPIINVRRTKWKSVEQMSPNFKFRWRRKTIIYTIQGKQIV